MYMYMYTYCSNLDQLVKVMNVDVYKDAIQPGEDLLADGDEHLGKRCA